MPKPKEVLVPEGVNQLAIFRGKGIRSVKHESEWWYSVIDIIEVLTESKDPRTYWKVLKSRLVAEGANELVTTCNQLKMTAADGKERLTDVMKVEDVLRLIQSVPSPKAEPFKRWLAKIGHERLQEYQNPELIIKRAMLQYQARGYDEDWIKIRVNNIIGRKELESEWYKRGIQNIIEFALLTDAMSVESFGIKTSQHKTLKKLSKHHKLRDNMTGLELLFTSLAEQSTARIAKSRDAQGFYPNQAAAKSGGKIAGDARRNLEQELGESVVSSQNYLTDKQRQNQKKISPSAQKKLQDMLKPQS